MRVTGHDIPLPSSQVRVESTSIGPGGGTYTLPTLTGGVALTTPAPSATVYQDVPLPTDDQSILVVLTHTALHEVPEWPGNTATIFGGPVVGQEAAAAFGVVDGDGFAPLRTYAIMPPYRVWSPLAIDDTGPIPQQWKQRRDGLAMDSVPSWRNSRDNQHASRWRGRI